MKSLKIILYTFLLSQLLFANEKQIKELASTIATPFYNVYTQNVIEILSNYVEKNKNIEAIQVYDTMLGQTSLIYYKKDGKKIFEKDKPFPNSFELPKAKHVVNIVKNEKTIGILTLYSTIKIGEYRLTSDEYKYLNTKKRITMCIDPDWEPYEQIDKNGNHIGLTTDFIKLIEKKLEKEITLINTNTWEESLKFAKNGKCEILSFLNQTIDREKYLNFTPVLFSEPEVIVSNNDVTYLDGFKSLENKTVGLVKGFKTAEIVLKNYPKIKVNYIKNYEEGIELVAQGKLDATVNSLLGTAYLIKKSQLHNIKIAGKTEFTNNYRIGIIKNEPILHSILSKVVSNITQIEKDRILSSWGTVKFEQKVDYSLAVQVILVALIIIFIFIYWIKKISTANRLLKEAKIVIEEKNQELTEKNKQLESSMHQTKMAALGEMIGNIAHQWRQPLSVISTASSGMQLKKEINSLSDEEFDEFCNNINDNAQYLSKTIDTFRDYIKGENKKSLFNLSHTIENLLSMLNGVIKSNNIQVITDMDKNINIDGYQNELIEALLNIINNAKDAMVINNTQNKYIFISTYYEHNTAFIKIKDNGGGIAKETIDKIFEPYFTTKHQSQGTGLGLYMTHQLILNSMNGNITVQNLSFKYNKEKYTGAEFFIELPLS